MKPISRRDFWKTAGGGILLLSLPFGSFSCSGRERPNIIYILADDLGYGDLGCYGQKKIRTPNLDRMAADGMKFIQHYAGSTVCAPSRCSLFTGKHTGHAYIRGNYEIGGYQLPLPAEEVTVAELLKQEGYSTGLIGKWGLGGPDTPGHPNRQGFDYFFGYLGQVQAHFYYPPHLWENESRVDIPENRNGQRGLYSHDLLAEKSLRFIRKHRHEPFFLVVTFTIPHAELLVPKEALGEYDGQFEEVPYSGGHYGAQPKPRAAYAAMVSRLDRDVGRIRALVEKLGLAKNTLILFSSDNGPHHEGGHDPDYFDSNGPFRGIKRDLYEGGIRVPFIAWWPGTIRPGSTSEHVSAFWDVLPTLCELAGIRPPKNTDGISFLPTLLGKPQKQHKYLYWEFHERKGAQAVRLGEWKGIRIRTGIDPNAPIELYNLREDPGETTDVAAKHPEIVAEIGRMMNQRTPSPIKRWNFVPHTGRIGSGVPKKDARGRRRLLKIPTLKNQK